MTPLISVVIPVYNNQELLHISIDSVLNQSYNNFELFIVNDGSTDNTENIIEQYCKRDDRIKYLFQRNKGVSEARNAGIREAEGKYICFLDSDDFYEKNYLSEMKAKIEIDNSDIVYCGTYLYNEEISKRMPTIFSTKNVLTRYIKSIIQTQTAGWMINKNIIDKNNLFFTPELSWGEDLEFLFKVIAVSSKVSYVNKFLINYRTEQREERLSTFSFEKIDYDYKLFSEMINDDVININKEVEEAILNYRLPASLVYRLWDAILLECDSDKIRSYYYKYRNNIEVKTWNNGFRSVKLNYKKNKLKKWILSIDN